MADTIPLPPSISVWIVANSQTLATFYQVWIVFINYILYIYCSHIADKTFEDADTYNLVDTASLETAAL